LLLSRAHFRFDSIAKFETLNYIYKLLKKAATYSVKPKGLYDADIIKNISESEFLSKNGIKKHKFKLRKTITYNNAETYVINFEPKEDSKVSLYSGNIFNCAKSLNDDESHRQYIESTYGNIRA
jgi:hypothetical protein